MSFHSLWRESKSAASDVCSAGPRSRLVVLIHSIGTYSAVWDDLVETLEDSGFLILRYDLLGMGFSGRAPVRNYSPKTMIMQLENLMKDLGVTARTYDLIGHGVTSLLPPLPPPPSSIAVAILGA